MTKKLDGIIDAYSDLLSQGGPLIRDEACLPLPKSEVKQALLARLIASRTEEERDLCLRNLTTAWATRVGSQSLSVRSS